MNSHIVKLSALGMAGMLVLAGNPMDAYAKQTLLTDNDSVAGVTVSLDSYLDSTKTEETTEQNISMVEASGNATVDGVNAVVEEEIVLNIKYDRLGIANVDGALNVRKRASTDAKVVGKMSNGAACNIEKVTKDGWAKIKSGEVTGYVKAEYLVMDEKAEEMALEVGRKVATVKTTTLNARYLPSTESGKYTLVPNGEELEVVRDNISEKYVSGFIEKHFSDKKKKKLIRDVNQDAMANELGDWICVSIDDEKVYIAREFVDISYELDRAVSTKTIAMADSEESGDSSSSSTGSVRSSMVSYAMQFLGNSYVYGGTSLTNGADCSGFVQSVFRNFGISIPRTAASQSGSGTPVSLSDIQPGDLLFYYGGGSIGHVTMYIGNGKVVHASSPSTGIIISNYSYRTPASARRYW